MAINEYDAIPELTCSECGTNKNVVVEECGNEICFQCLFEKKTEEYI